MTPRRFRIAFSFAGEKRDFVAGVAAILAKRFGEAAILYDRFHEAEFARHDLGVYLPKLYSEQSDLIVPVLCNNYDQKRWTGWEWLHIYGLLTTADSYRVMPCRFEHANADGLSPAAGFVELDDKTPQQAVTLILQRLALNAGKPKDYYTELVDADAKRLSTSTPNNLPRLQPFFGREKELLAIKEALNPESRTWGALIDGPGGMGKTSLAVRAAYDCSPGLFQRIVFISVKDREMDDDGVRTLGNLLVPGFLEMLNELARELGQPEIAKSPENERIQLLLDALRVAQVLLILDNLESLSKTDRDQLFNFVKRLPQGCKAILTSRRRIGSGSEELILEKLEEEAALATLADLSKHNKLLQRTNKAERVSLYVQTSGKPLLLRWVAGQLGRGSCRTLSDALAYLRSCPRDNDPLEFIFGDLAKEFSHEEEKVLCGLTYFSLPAEVGHIAAIADLEKESTETALRSLANRSLVVPDQEEKRHAIVPMVAEFLRKYRCAVIADTGLRLEKRAYALILENGGTNYDRFPLLDAAWPTVAPALPLFGAGSGDRLQSMYVAVNDFLNFTGRWDEWLSLSLQAEAKAIASSDYKKAGARAYQVAYIHYLRGQGDKVLAYADRTEAHFQRSQAGQRAKALVSTLRGHGYRLKKNHSAAIAAYRATLDLYRDLSRDSDEVGTAHTHLAHAKRAAGDLDGAEHDYREGLRIARAVDSVEAIAIALGRLADIALSRKDWLGAQRLAGEALPLSESLGRQELIALDCRRLAEGLSHQGKAAQALPFARRAVEIFARLRSPDLEHARAALRDCEGDLPVPSSRTK